MFAEFLVKIIVAVIVALLTEEADAAQRIVQQLF